MSDIRIPTEEELARKKKWQRIWDKVTTGILVALICSPIIILVYIFIWFLNK